MNTHELNSLPATTDPFGNILESPVSRTVFVAFDTETTGLSASADRLVELSGVKFTADGEDIGTFQTLIDPEMAIPSAASAVHGITDKMVKGKPTSAQVVPNFLEWAITSGPAQGIRSNVHPTTVLLAHNAPFDLGFLAATVKKYNLAVPRNVILDTLKLSRKLIEGSANYQLRTLVEFLGIASPTYHRALADSYHVKHLFLKMQDLLPPDATIGDLALIGGKLHLNENSQEKMEKVWHATTEMACIEKAIKAGQQLLIHYAAAKDSERIVTPRSVVYTQGKPYLSAYCHNSLAERTFRIDKIVKVEALTKSHET